MHPSCIEEQYGILLYLGLIRDFTIVNIRLRFNNCIFEIKLHKEIDIHILKYY